MDEKIQSLANISRRHFLLESAMGLGAVALGSLFGRCSTPQTAPPLAENVMDPMRPRPSHFLGKARRVIFLHMAGAPSQLELFDYKPELQKLNNQLCPPSLLEGKRFAFIRGTPKMLGPQATFRQRGQSGAYVSDHLPHFSQLVDEVSFLKGVYTDQFNHAPAQLFVHTGAPRLGIWTSEKITSTNSRPMRSAAAGLFWARNATALPKSASASSVSATCQPIAAPWFRVRLW